MVISLCKGKNNFRLSISRNADGYSTPLQLQMQPAWPYSPNFVILTNRKSISFRPIQQNRPNALFTNITPSREPGREPGPSLLIQWGNFFPFV